MVPSGFVTTCLFAGSPTISWPSWVSATTEGNILPAGVAPSALGMTTGLPPSITAAAEFVVPRSIPSIFSLGLLTYSRLLLTLCSCSQFNLYHARPDYLSPEQVPRTDFLSDDVLRSSLPLHFLDGLVQPGVERLA